MLPVDTLIKYVGSGDVERDYNATTDEMGLFLRTASVMIETQLETKVEVKKMVKLSHDPFFLPRPQLVYRLNEAGLPIVYNIGETLGFDWPSRRPDPDLEFVDYWLRRIYQYGTRLNRKKGTTEAIKAVLRLIWLDLTDLSILSGTGRTPFDSDTTLDGPLRRFDSGDCKKCLKLGATISFLNVPGFEPPAFESLSDDIKTQISVSIYKVFNWGLPIDCQLSTVTFDDVNVVNPDPLRQFTNSFDLSFS